MAVEDDSRPQSKFDRLFRILRLLNGEGPMEIADLHGKLGSVCLRTVSRDIGLLLKAGCVAKCQGGFRSKVYFVERSE